MTLEIEIQKLINKHYNLDPKSNLESPTPLVKELVELFNKQQKQEKPFLKVFLDWFIYVRPSNTKADSFDEVIEKFGKSKEYKSFCELKKIA